MTAATPARPAPKYAVGDIVYDSAFGYNAPIVAVEWREANRGWVYSTKMHTACNFAPASPWAVTVR